MADRPSFEQAVEQLCVLEDPVRRSVYLAVRAAAAPVDRADVARATGISTRLAAFHLEKLLEEGYVDAFYPPGPRRRLAGRPRKHYRPANLELEVSIPPRRYDLIAEILVEALAKQSDGHDHLDEIAARYGRRIGSAVRADAGETRLVSALRRVGYEPIIDGDDIVLRNCPFHRAAEMSREVVCNMNRAFVTGLLAGTRAGSRVAVLDPAPQRCCVRVATQAGT